VIGLGLRLTMNGGREAVTRLVMLVVAVGIGVGLLLVAVAGVNAVNNQNDKFAWLSTAVYHGAPPGVHQGSTAPVPQVPAGSTADPLWFVMHADTFKGQTIAVVDVAATGPSSPVPPGIAHLPGPGQYYASPALTALLKANPAAELGDRYPGHQVGIIGEAALPAANSLIVVVGSTPAQMAQMPGAQQATSINTAPPNGCPGTRCLSGEGVNAAGIDLILSVVALAILFPVLIFIGTATRLSAARREQRFAAMRLAGASPRQISMIAAVESTVASVLGVAVGFVIFTGLRIPLASIPFTGAPFEPSEMSLSVADIAAVAIGVPVAAAVAARLALRRVNMTPLGVTRRVTPKPARAWRVLPLLAGLAELGWFAAAGRPVNPSGQVQAFLSSFLLIMMGLVLSGPWLTMMGARLMARRTSRPGGLIAARRLADDPRAGFRAVSGLVLALFIATVAAALISTQDAKGPHRDGGVLPVTGALASDTMVDMVNPDPEAAPGPVAGASLTARLQAIHGVGAIAVVHNDPLHVTVPPSLLGFPSNLPGPPLRTGLISCAQLARVPALGRCPAGAQVVAVTPWDWYAGKQLTSVTWPAVHIPATRLAGLGTDLILVTTDGTTRTTETARTVLESVYPSGSAITFAEAEGSGDSSLTGYQQLADVAVLVSLVVAGSTLATAVAAGLADRKRPFSLLRLAGTPLGLLRRVVALESAVPLLMTAAVAIGAGFAAAAMFARSEMQAPMVGPGPAFYLITVAGIVLSLGVIAATIPLLRRITGPEVARNE
jgi:hypothetical protein